MTQAERAARAMRDGEIAILHLHLRVRLTAQLAHGTGGSLGLRHGSGTVILERE